jgi:hypothetical protein
MLLKYCGNFEKDCQMMMVSDKRREKRGWAELVAKWLKNQQMESEQKSQYMDCQD